MRRGIGAARYRKGRFPATLLRLGYDALTLSPSERICPKRAEMTGVTAMTPHRRIVPRSLALLPLTTLIASVSWAMPAFADDAPHVCEGVFDAPVSPDVSLVTDPPARSDARPGDVVRIDATWNPDGWDSLSSAAACVKVWKTLDPALSKVETPITGAGAAHHEFTIANDYFDGTAICTRYRLAGDPAGLETEAVRVSKQACVEVHPEEAPDDTTPTTTTPTTSTPATTPTTTVSTPTTAPRATPTKPAEVPGPSPDMAWPDLPLEQSLGNPSSPGVNPPTVEGSKTNPPNRPIYLAELPRTGTSTTAPLGLYGGMTAAAGLAALALARLIPGRRRTEA